MDKKNVINEEIILDADQDVNDFEGEDIVLGKDQANCQDPASEQEIRTEGKEEEDLRIKHLRLAADFQNFKRRSEKEKSDIYAYANEKIIVELLDVIDNFERAMDHKCEAEESKVMEGMEMILKQLQDVLEKNHLEEINALGQHFDPNYHHAVMTENCEEKSGTVVKVLQKGYMLNKKVIRPTMVAVAQ